MNRHFSFKSFWNFLKRNKLYTAINVFGFAVSLMFVVLFGLYLQRERSVDGYHEKGDRIYRMSFAESAYWPHPAAADLAGRYPEIEAVTMVTENNLDLRTDERERIIEEALLVDSSFFSVFTYSFVEGSPASALRTKQELVLSESFARRLFGAEPALGRTIRTESAGDMIVSGVVRDATHSHIGNYGVIARNEVIEDVWGWPGALQHWGVNNFALYVLERPGASLAAKLPDIVRYMGENSDRYTAAAQGIHEGLWMEPLRELYFSPVNAQRYVRTNDPGFLSTLGATILLILFFAVINYTNLSVAQTGFRAKEASIRRLLGGTRMQLFGSFIFESVLLCTLSLLLAVGLAALMRPWFDRVMGADTSISALLTGGNLLLVVGGLLVLSCLAGLVPALMISRYKPVEVVRGTFRRQTKMVYSKVLIGFQYAITIVLIGCTVTIMRQVGFMTKSDLGFNKDFIVQADIGLNEQQRELFRNRLSAISGVEQVAFSAGAPMSQTGMTNRLIVDRNDQPHRIREMVVDTAFFSMMGIEVVSETGNADPGAIWLNEAAWRDLGLAEDATEYTDGPEWYRQTLRGKIRDFHFEDFSKSIGPLALLPLGVENNGSENTYTSVMLLKVAPGDAYGTMRRIEQTYNELAGGRLFDSQARLMDERVATVYARQKRLSTMMGWLSALAIVISALGMLAMATYFIRQRAQEVAVRKVFGAMDVEILKMLMWNFLRLVILAFILAVPVIWYLMREWLAGYVYRIPVTWDIFAAAGIAALTIAGLTVLWQSMRAARANPILAIKD